MRSVKGCSYIDKQIHGFIRRGPTLWRIRKWREGERSEKPGGKRPAFSWGFLESNKHRHQQNRTRPLLSFLEARWTPRLSTQCWSLPYWPTLWTLQVINVHICMLHPWYMYCLRYLHIVEVVANFQSRKCHLCTLVLLEKLCSLLGGCETASSHSQLTSSSQFWLRM